MYSAICYCCKPVNCSIEFKDSLPLAPDFGSLRSYCVAINLKRWIPIRRRPWMESRYQNEQAVIRATGEPLLSATSSLHRAAKQWRPQRRSSRPSGAALPISPAASRLRLSSFLSTRRRGCGRCFASAARRPRVGPSSASSTPPTPPRRPRRRKLRRTVGWRRRSRRRRTTGEACCTPHSSTRA
jgi:hypothetical protein